LSEYNNNNNNKGTPYTCSLFDMVVHMCAVVLLLLYRWERSSIEKSVCVPASHRHGPACVLRIIRTWFRCTRTDCVRCTRTQRKKEREPVASVQLLPLLSPIDDGRACVCAWFESRSPVRLMGGRPGRGRARRNKSDGVGGGGEERRRRPCLLVCIVLLGEHTSSRRCLARRWGKKPKTAVLGTGTWLFSSAPTCGAKDTRHLFMDRNFWAVAGYSTRRAADAFKPATRRVQLVLGGDALTVEFIF